jgi:hypothetical protein
MSRQKGNKNINPKCYEGQKRDVITNNEYSIKAALNAVAILSNRKTIDS